MTVTVIAVISFSPPGVKETVQIKTPSIGSRFKKINQLSDGKSPIAELTVVKEPARERVYCGSPAQRNWKNPNASNIAIGRRLASEKGWTGAQFDALKELWSCESSWTTEAGNTQSGAYGIPQSLPASKMSSKGADYMTNPETQIRWGLDYIESRYGDPQSALRAHYLQNWY